MKTRSRCGACFTGVAALLLSVPDSLAGAAGTGGGLAGLWHDHRGIAAGTGALLLLLLFTVFALLAAVARRRRIEAALQKAYSGLHREAHEHEAARAALARSEANLRHLFDHAPVAICEADASDLGEWFGDLRAKGVTDLAEHMSREPGFIAEALAKVRIIDANEAAVRLCEAESREDLLRRAAGLDGLGGRPGISRLLLALWQSCGDTAIEFDGVTLKGNRVEGVLHWHAQERGGRVDLDKAVLAFTDLTARREAERALLASEERFRNLAERVRIIPWECDARTGCFTYVGPQAADILGYPVEAWYKDGFWLAHIHDDDREDCDRICREASQTRDQYEFEYRMKTPSGDIVWFRDIVHVVRDDRGASKLRGFLVDITALKEAERIMRDTSAELERRVEERTAELRRMVRAMAGREVRMQELKRVIDKLSDQLRQHGMAPVARDPGGREGA